jgi:hypothetical protein
MWLRGGPPWTTKLRLAAMFIPILVTSIVCGVLAGAAIGACRMVVDLAGACSSVWRDCDRETVRRLAADEKEVVRADQEE